MSFSLEKKKIYFLSFPFVFFFFIVFYVLGQVQQQPNYIAGGEETGPKERDRSSPRFPLMVVIIITPTSECMGSSFSSSRKKKRKKKFLLLSAFILSVRSPVVLRVICHTHKSIYIYTHRTHGARFLAHF